MPTPLDDAGRPLASGDDTPTPSDLSPVVTPERRDPLDAVTRAAAPPPVVIPGEGGLPTFTLARTSLSFVARASDPRPAMVEIAVTNSGSGVLGYIAVSSHPTLVHVAPRVGLAPGMLQVTALTTGQPAGTTAVTITLTASAASNSPQVLTVTVTVLPAVTTPTDPSVIPPIGKPLLLGYYDVAGRNVAGQPVASAGAAVAATTGAGNVAVVEGAADNFTSTQDWQTSQRLAADALNGLGAKIICRMHEDDVANLASRWDMVAALYTHDEAALGVALLNIERRCREVRTRIDALGLANKPVLCYFTGAQLDAPGFYVPDGVDWVGVEAYADFAAAVQSSSETARAYLRTVVPPRMARLPAHVRIILIGQGYDRNGLWTNAESLAGLQTVYPELVARDARVDGILWFAYLRTGGTEDYPAVRAWHEAIYRAAVRGFPPSVSAVPNFRALGAVTRLDCTQIEGWAFNPTTRSTQVQVQVFLGDRHTFAPPNHNQNRVIQVVANLSHTDPALTTATSLAATTRSHGQHWFRVPMPASLKDGTAKTLYVYGVSMLDGQQTILAASPAGVTCAAGGGGGGGTGGGGTGVTLPSAAAVRAWSGNFLNLLGDFDSSVGSAAFLYPGESSVRREQMRTAMRAANWTHLPFAAWGTYPAMATYDYRTNVPGFRSRLEEVYRAGLIPCWFAITDQLSGSWTEAQADAFIRDFAPKIKDLLVAACLGWEIPQVAGMSASATWRRLLATLRSVLGPSIPIYVHFPPGQWGPNGGEVAWWESLGTTCDGLLWQTEPSEAVATSIATTLTASGPGGGGVCGRVKALGKRFVWFESRRNEATHAQIRAAARGDSRVDGYC